MTDDEDVANLSTSPQCDCGYRCQGETVEERVRDGQRHARELHGIDVAPDQVLRAAQPRIV
jgi:predicted small metal-binding protein